MATSSVGNLPSTAALPAQEAAGTHRAAPIEDARGAKAPDGKSSLRQQQNVQILQASMDVSIQSGDSSLALLYRTAIDRINEYLEPELGPNAIGGKDAPDGSPEGTAGRILSLSTAFYDAYAALAKNKDKDPDTLARVFVDLIRGGFERGFGEARDILSGMGVLPCQFMQGENAQSLGLTGREVFDFGDLKNGEARTVTVTATPESGTPIRFEVRVRIDTPKERDYFRHGGILHYVLRNLVAA